MRIWKHIRNELPILHAYLAFWFLLMLFHFGWSWFCPDTLWELGAYLILQTLLMAWCLRATILNKRRSRDECECPQERR